VREARIETLKMMSFTDPGVFDRLRRENASTSGGIEFIVRLYDDRLRRDSRPSPADFVAKMTPIIKRLRPYTAMFEIHNEPNHVAGIEGWGASDADARAFRDWYMKVLPALKKACPWAKFGFPGLALNHPHRDLAWLDICRKAVLASDWLGCHTYWQYGNMMKDDWGLRFKLYHQRFPNKPIEITEFGNSTPDLPRDKIAQQYAQYYQELNKYPYLGSASAFIASSPDPTWALFVWLKEGGEMLPVVHAVRDMPRKAVNIPAPPPAPKPKPPVEPPASQVRKFPQTGKTVRGSFLKFLNQYGLDICGYPITEQISEAGVQTQYFQRVGLEESELGKIRLRMVGTEAWTSREKIARLESQIMELRGSAPGRSSLAKPPVQDIIDELPTHPSKSYPSRTLSDINQIVIHHTGTSPAFSAQRMARYQVQRMGKPGISYHFFVSADGTIFHTNGLQTITDHAYARSRDSVGVCFAGNFGSSIPTPTQLQAGAALCAWLLDTLHLTTDTVVGLNEFMNAHSPGRQWLSDQCWKDKLLTIIEALLKASERDPSTLFASLQRGVRALQVEVELLKKESLPSPIQASTQEIMDRLSDLVMSLQVQIRVLQGESSRTAASVRPADEDQISLTADTEAQIETLSEEQGQIQRDIEATPGFESDEAASLIASLRAKINSLQEEIQRLREQLPGGAPVVGPREISKPPILDSIGKLCTHESKQYQTRPPNAIKTLVIHHSAVPPRVGPQQVAAYHVNRLDWPGVGYHFLVGADGIIYQANSVETISYHAANVNPRGVGICFLGDFTKEVPPSPQLLAGAHLVAWLMQELNIALDEVKGHKELMGTACPGIQWLEGKNWKQMLHQEVVQMQCLGHPAPLPSPDTKSMDHYMLFWERDGHWARGDWLNAQGYIETFRPSVGFSANHAALAEHVTIVGGPLGVSQKVEDGLRSRGCKIDRVAGKDEADTKRMLDDLVKQGKRFRGFDG
jgi:N-acetyl-anhydromuramyl-L-alanine amidase AmpD